MVEQTEKFLKSLGADYEILHHRLVDKCTFLIEQRYGSTGILIDWEIDLQYMTCYFRISKYPSTNIYLDGMNNRMRCNQETWDQFSKVVRHLIYASHELRADIDDFSHLIGPYYVGHMYGPFIGSCVRTILNNYIPEIGCEDLDTLSDLPPILKESVERKIRRRSRFIEFLYG